MMVSTRLPDRTPLIATLFAMLLLSTGLASVFVPVVAGAQSATNVSIVNYAFNPSSIVVVVGVNNTVMWTNNGTVDHTVTADDGSFSSGNIAPGTSFTHIFTAAGNYSYHCSIHNYMKGTIIVVNAASTSSSSSSSGGIPEFPFQAVALTIITVLVLASYVVVRKTLRPRNQSL